MPLQHPRPAGRLRSAWRWYKERPPVVRIGIPFGLGFASIAGAWTVLNEEEYAVALGLIILFLLFGIQAIRETAWSSTAKWIVSLAFTVIALYSGAVILKKAEGKPWSNLFADEEEALRIPHPTISPGSPEPVYTHYGDTMLLKGAERNLWILMGIYGYPGTRQVLDLEIQNLSPTEKVYFGSKLRPASGVIEPNKTQRWQRINLEELYLQTDKPPVRIRVTCVFAREKAN